MCPTHTNCSPFQHLTKDTMAGIKLLILKQNPDFVVVLYVNHVFLYAISSL